MIGPFKPTSGGFRYVYVAIDKFSKWIEYKLLLSATAEKAVELFEELDYLLCSSQNKVACIRSTWRTCQW